MLLDVYGNKNTEMRPFVGTVERRDTRDECALSVSWVKAAERVPRLRTQLSTW